MLLALGLLGNGATEEQATAALDAIQARYDGISDLSADFVQTSYTAALGSESILDGRVTMKRPRFIRWEYSPPDERVIVLNSDTLRIYSPLDEQLQIAGLAEGTASPTALSFLLGEGVLRELFTAVAIDADERAELGLRLDPRQESSFEFIELWVDRETYQLRESVMVDLFKNRTGVRFDSIEENVGVDDSSFDLRVPEGTEIIDIR